jgi:hypothetical protein
METKTQESDPNGMKAGEKGAKLDAGKPAVWRGLLDYFPRACLAVADVSTRGAAKYSWKGWEAVKDGEARYGDALARHIVKESIDGPFDVGPGGLGPEVLHASQIAWNALARLELILRRLNADTTIPEPSTDVVGTNLCTADTSTKGLISGGSPVQQQPSVDGV